MSFEPRSRRIEDLERKLEALAYVASSRDLATSPAGDPAVLGVVRSALQQLHAVREDMERVAAERDVARTALGQARECEARWRSIVENPFDYVLIVDRDATLQYVNRTLPGTRKEDLIGKATVFDFVAPEFHETVRGALDRVFETGEFVHFEVYAKPPVDDWFRTLVGAVKENGNVVAASMFSCNIVRRKQVEKALGESEERFRQLTEHIEDVFYLIEPETRRVLYVSPAYERLWGRPLQTVYDDALAWTKAIHPEDRDRVLAGFESLTDSNYSFGSAREYRIVRPDGSLRWVRGRNFAIRDEDGNLSRVAGIVTDITERKEARAKIAEAESKYRLLVEKLPVISYIAALDDARTTIYISPQIEWKLGFTQAEWTADPGLWMKRIHPDDRARTLAAMRRFRETGEPLRTVYRLMSRGGEALWFRDEAVLVSDDSGKPTRVQGVMLDISEAEEARAERQRARALSAQLVEVQEAERRSIARELHDEIGQTLTGLKLLLEMIGSSADAEQGGRLREARGLVNELMSKVRDLSLELRPAMLDDLGLLPALLWLFERYAARTKVDVRFEHRGIERRFAADVETAAYRVVQEALTNVARHAMVRDVKVRVWSDASTLNVQITDSGVGFEAAAAFASRRSNGLVGMRERVALLGGELTMASIPSEGTCLTAQLPLLCGENLEPSGSGGNA